MPVADVLNRPDVLRTFLLVARPKQPWDQQEVLVTISNGGYGSLSGDTLASTLFRRGLIRPYSSRLDFRGIRFVGKQLSKNGDIQISNLNGEFDDVDGISLVELDWAGTTVEVFVAETPGTYEELSFDSFERIFTGTADELRWDEEMLTIPLADRGLSFEAEISERSLKGLSACLRIGASGSNENVSWDSTDGTSFSLNDSDLPVTFSIRVKRSSIAGVNSFIFIHDVNWRFFFDSSDRFRFSYVEDGDKRHRWGVDGQSDDDEWHWWDIVLLPSPFDAIIYRDGVAQDVTTFSVIDPTTQSQTWASLGAINEAGTSSNFDGEIDEFRAFGKQVGVDVLDDFRNRPVSVSEMERENGLWNFRFNEPGLTPDRVIDQLGLANDSTAVHNGPLHIGSLEGPPASEGRTAAKAHGRVRQVEPQLVDEFFLVYLLNDGPMGRVISVSDNGTPTILLEGEVDDVYAAAPASGFFDHDRQNGLIRLGASPDGNLTADYDGSDSGMSYALCLRNSNVDAAFVIPDAAAGTGCDIADTDLPVTIEWKQRMIEPSPTSHAVFLKASHYLLTNNPDTKTLSFQYYTDTSKRSTWSVSGASTYPAAFQGAKFGGSAAWHRISVVIGASPTFTIKLYIDGVLQTPDSETLVAATKVGTNDLKFFGTTGGIGSYWNGELNDFRIWDAERSAAEILANKDILVANDATNLRTNFRMDEGTGTGTGAVAQASTAGNGGPDADIVLSGGLTGVEWCGTHEGVALTPLQIMQQVTRDVVGIPDGPQVDPGDEYIDVEDFGQADIDALFEAGFYNEEKPVEAGEVMEIMAESANAFWSQRRDGGVTATRLFDPEFENEDFEVTDDTVDLGQRIQRRQTGARVWKVVQQYKKNYQTQKRNDLAAAAVLTEAEIEDLGKKLRSAEADDANVLANFPRAQELVLKGLMDTAEGGRRVANDVLTLLKKRRSLYSIPVHKQVFLREAGDIARVYLTRQGAQLGTRANLLDLSINLDQALSYVLNDDPVVAADASHGISSSSRPVVLEALITINEDIDNLSSGLAEPDTEWFVRSNNYSLGASWHKDNDFRIRIAPFAQLNTGVGVDDITLDAEDQLDDALTFKQTREFIHVAARFDGIQSQLYVNAIPVTTNIVSAAGSAISNVAIDFFESASPSSREPHLIDEVRIWDAGVDRTEMELDFWKYRPLIQSQIDLGMTGYWRFDELNASGNVADLSGNDNDLDPDTSTLTDSRPPGRKFIVVGFEEDASSDIVRLLLWG
jgi:hypothetical protein